MTRLTDLELLNILKRMATPTYDLEYSILAGKLYGCEARLIVQAVQVAIDHLQDKLKEGKQ